MSTPTPTASTPSPALVAASPYLKSALTDLKQLVTTILTGDPMQAGLRAGPAAQIFLGQIELLEPGILGAEEGVLGTTVNTQIDGLIAKLP